MGEVTAVVDEDTAATAAAALTTTAAPATTAAPSTTRPRRYGRHADRITVE